MLKYDNILTIPNRAILSTWLFSISKTYNIDTDNIDNELLISAYYLSIGYFWGSCGNTANQFFDEYGFISDLDTFVKEVFANSILITKKVRHFLNTGQ
jgi:hypothetical protein